MNDQPHPAGDRRAISGCPERTCIEHIGIEFAGWEIESLHAIGRVQIHPANQPVIRGLGFARAKDADPVTAACSPAGRRGEPHPYLLVRPWLIQGDKRIRADLAARGLRWSLGGRLGLARIRLTSNGFAHRASKQRPDIRLVRIPRLLFFFWFGVWLIRT